MLFYLNFFGVYCYIMDGEIEKKLGVEDSFFFYVLILYFVFYLCRTFFLVFVIFTIRVGEVYNYLVLFLWNFY